MKVEIQKKMRYGDNRAVASTGLALFAPWSRSRHRGGPSMYRLEFMDDVKLKAAGFELVMDEDGARWIIDNLTSLLNNT